MMYLKGSFNNKNECVSVYEKQSRRLQRIRNQAALPPSPTSPHVLQNISKLLSLSTSSLSSKDQLSLLSHSSSERWSSVSEQILLRFKPITHSPFQDPEGEDCESPLWLKRQTWLLSPMEHRDKGTQGRILRQVPINLNNRISEAGSLRAAIIPPAQACAVAKKSSPTSSPLNSGGDKRPSCLYSLHISDSVVPNIYFLLPGELQLTVSSMARQSEHSTSQPLASRHGQFPKFCPPNLEQKE